VEILFIFDGIELRENKKIVTDSPTRAVALSPGEGIAQNIILNTEW